MLRFKRGIAALLLLVMLTGMLPLQAFAQESEGTEPTEVTESVEVTEPTEVTEPAEAEPMEITESTEAAGPNVGNTVLINPVYAGILTEQDLVIAEDIPMLLEDEVYTSVETAANALRAAMVAHQTTFTINLETKNAVADYYSVLLDKAIAHNGIAGQGDNLLYQYGGVRVEYGDSYYGGTYYYYVKYTITYMTTAAQDAAVAQAVTKLRKQLILDELATDVEKIVRVYNWMCENIVYDYAGLNDSSDLLEYTAYDAIINKAAVCQGYANLFYWIMLEEGIDCRIISGYSNGEAHAWNIVKVGNKYYNVDATWDANWKCRYFLKGSTNFGTDHQSNSEYTTSAFKSAYPIDTEDYVTTMYYGASGANNTWNLDNDGTLTIRGEGVMDDFSTNSEVYWSEFFMCIDRVIVENGITVVGDRAFQALSVTQARVGSTVTEIGKYAFGSCRKLTTVYLPASITLIDFAAFYDCPELKTVVFCGTPEQWAAITVKNGNDPLSAATLQYHDYVDGACAGCGSTNCATSGHTWKTATCSAPKTCSACGTTEGAALGHNWVAATCTTPKTCDRCDTTEGAALGHDWADATCTEPRTCGRCGTTEGAAPGHNWTDATCTAPKSCKNCTATEGAALGHNWTDATCTVPKTCGRCDATEGAALGHNWTDATCTEPKTCGRCGTTEGTALGHNYENGSCTRCGEAFVTLTGKCGDNLTWTLDGTGKLTISGTGAMSNYSQTNLPPWRNKGIQISSIVVESGATSVGDYAFNECGAKEISLPTTLKTIGTAALAYNAMTELAIPEGVTSVGDYAVSDCSKLTDLELPETLKTIGAYAFARTYIQVLDIPDSVITVKKGAFYSCPVLEVVYLSSSIKTISERAFQYCQNLSVVVMPGSVTNIEAYAFSDCDKLSIVYYLGSEAEVARISFAAGNNDLLGADWYLMTVATKDPADVTTSAGTIATFSTGASRSNVAYQWYYLAPDSEEWLPCTGSSATKATYSVTVTEEMNGYLFWCIMTDEYGNEFACDYAALTVVPAPKITKQPENVQVKNGQTVSVTVEATGTDLSYQWYYANKGSSKFSKSSITDTTYSAVMDDTRDGRRVYCIVTDAYGSSVISQTVTLTMEKTPLAIVAQPQDVAVEAGETANITVEATGDGLTYKWYYKNAGATKFSYTSSFTGNVYTATMSDSRDGRQVYCVITDKYGNSVTTQTATMTKYVPLKITAQPKDVCVEEGKTAKVTVNAQGVGLTYEWFYADKDTETFEKLDGVTGNVYSTTLNAQSAGRKLYCKVSDKFGDSVCTETVTISKKTLLKIIQQPKMVGVLLGETATVTVEVEGDDLTYTWYYAAKSSSKYKKDANFTGNSYSMEMTDAYAGRKVYCVVRDAYGKSVKTSTVSLNKLIPLAITSQPEDVKVAFGQKAAVKFTVTGDSLKYKWYYKDANMAEFAYTKSFTGTSYSVKMSGARDGRQVYCVITDKYGDSVTTNTVTLRQGTTLTIATQPTNVAVELGQTASVTVEAVGDGLTYTWYYAAKGSRYKTAAEFTGNSYSVEMTDACAGRKVYCVVRDAYGKTVKTKTVTLYKLIPLVITSQPGDVQVAAGQKAVVKVTATGEGLKYKWYYKNADMAEFAYTKSFTGTSYSVKMSGACDGRQVYCVITDKHGNTVTTNTVTLAQKPKTVAAIITQPVSVSVASGEVAAVTVEAVGDGLTYKWYYKNAGASKFSYTSSFSGDTYSVEMTASRSGRQVYCKITDAYGNTVTTNTVTLQMG